MNTKLKKNFNIAIISDIEKYGFLKNLTHLGYHKKITNDWVDTFRVEVVVE